MSLAGLACELWRPRCENSSRLGPHITQQARRLVIRPRCNGRHFLFFSAGALPHSLSRKYIGGCRPSSEARRARSPCVGLLLYENSEATRTRRRHDGSNVSAVAGALLDCEALFLYGSYQLRFCHPLIVAISSLVSRRLCIFTHTSSNLVSATGASELGADCRYVKANSRNTTGGSRIGRIHRVRSFKFF